MLRGELQSSACHRWEGADFADHRGDASDAQPFLHRPQDVGVACDPHQHQARGIESMRCKTGPVKVRLSEAPQHDAVRNISGSPEPRDGTGGEGGGEGAVFIVAARPENFMQGTARQAAARQCPVDRGDPKRQYAMCRRRRPLNPPNLFTQHRQIV
jgi:hypothetical protein